MRSSLLPWEIHQDLTRDRLVMIAGLIALGRNEALERYEPDVGDNPWTLGCRAYAFGKHQILRASGDGRHAWLQIVDGGQQFTFRVGGIPIRFYRGAADDPHQRTLQQAFPELKQLALAFGDGRDLRGMIFRLAVETGIDGEITQIIFLAFGGESVHCYWPIPLHSAATVLQPVQESRAEGVPLPAPTVRLSESDEDQAGSAGKAG